VPSEGSHLSAKSLRAVARVLADYASWDGRDVRPSVALIAAESDFSERAVQYALRELERSGLLVIVKRSSGRPGCPNEYRLHCPAVVEKPAENLGTTDALARANGASSAPHGCTPLHPTLYRPVEVQEPVESGEAVREAAELWKGEGLPLAELLERGLSAADADAALARDADAAVDAGDLDRLAARLRGGDAGTARVLAKLRDCGCGEREFALAVESLEHRKRRTDRTPLVSEARYVVATLTSLLNERTKGVAPA
jgi:hypothetical protein